MGLGGRTGLLNTQDKAKTQTQWHLEVLLCILARVGGIGGRKGALGKEWAGPTAGIKLPEEKKKEEKIQHLLISRLTQK